MSIFLLSIYDWSFSQLISFVVKSARTTDGFIADKCHYSAVTLLNPFQDLAFDEICGSSVVECNCRLFRTLPSCDSCHACQNNFCRIIQVRSFPLK